MYESYLNLIIIGPDDLSFLPVLYYPPGVLSMGMIAILNFSVYIFKRGSVMNITILL